MASNSIPGYKLKKKLGAGAMASVYLAKDEKLHRDVALKVMSPKLLSDPSFIERFLREARLVASISHRNIVTVFDVGSHGNYHYMAMEYLPGGDLSSKLKTGFSLEDCIACVIDIAEGLDYAASKNCIHRDIKPDNIMFAEDGHAIITDFGIARDVASDSNMTIAGSIIGTPQYMSPEQAGGKELDHRTDLYSLGVILFQMLTGATPFKGDTAIATVMMHINNPVPALPGKCHQFQGLIDKALAKEPDERFQSGREFVEALRAIPLEISEDDDATMVFNVDDVNTQTSGAASEDFMSNLSEEFLSTGGAASDEEEVDVEETQSTEETEKEAVENSSAEPVEVASEEAVAKQAETESKDRDTSGESQQDKASLSVAETEAVKSREPPAKKTAVKKSFTLPRPKRSTVILVSIVIGLPMAHMLYVNVAGKYIPFYRFAEQLNGISRSIGADFDFYPAAQSLRRASYSFARAMEPVLGELEKASMQAVGTPDGKTGHYLSLFDKALKEGRLYQPTFDCAQIYFLELQRANAGSQIIQQQANKLLEASLDQVAVDLEKQNRRLALETLEQAKAVLPHVSDGQLKQRYRLVYQTVSG